MADIKIDEEMLLRAGLGIGYAFAPFFRGIMNGVEDYTIEQAAREMQEEHDAQEAEEGLKRPVEKTLIGVAGSAGAINARSWNNAFTCAKARFRTGYARSLASGARTECASSLAKKNGAPISNRAQDLITADKTKKRTSGCDVPDVLFSSYIAVKGAIQY